MSSPSGWDKTLLKCSVFHQCPPVGLNMYPLTVCNNMDTFINVSWLRSWPTWNVESDKSAQNDMITLSPSIHCVIFFLISVAKDTTTFLFLGPDTLLCGTQPQQNCPPLCVQNFHTDGEAEYRRMIPALKKRGNSVWCRRCMAHRPDVQAF